MDAVQQSAAESAAGHRSPRTTNSKRPPAPAARWRTSSATSQYDLGSHQFAIIVTVVDAKI